MTEREKELVMQFIHTIDGLRSIHREKLLIDLSAAEFRFLRTIQEFQSKHPEVQGIYVNDLAERLYVTKSAASKMLRQLEQRGLIERRTDPADRRNTFVCMTHAGEDLGERQRQRFDRFLLEIVDDMGEEHFTDILNGLRELTQAVNDRMEHMA